MPMNHDLFHTSVSDSRRLARDRHRGAARTAAVLAAAVAVTTGAACAQEAAIGTLPRDLSPWGMFLNADIVVKAVMVGLVFASVVTWTVWLAKNLELWRATRAGRITLAVLNEARSLAEANARLGPSDEPVARLLQTAIGELQSSPESDPDGLKERISWLLARVEAAASRRI